MTDLEKKRLIDFTEEFAEAVEEAKARKSKMTPPPYRPKRRR